MSNSEPLVTVVMPFLDAGRFIRESIESVLAQSYDRWELFLVDDGSTDESTEIAKEFARQFPGRVRYLEHPNHENRGISASRNLGVATGTGELISCLDADDIWLPEKLRDQVALFQRYPEVGFLFGRTLNWFSWTDDAEHPDQVVDPGIEMGVVLPETQLIAAMIPRIAVTPSQSCMIMRREVVEAAGGYEESFRGMYEDQAFVAKINLLAPCYIADRLWHRYRQHPDSMYMKAKAGGDRSHWRIEYLEWVIDYMQRQGPAGEPLVRLAEEELRPLLARRKRSVARRIASAGKRILRSAIKRTPSPDDH